MFIQRVTGKPALAKLMLPLLVGLVVATPATAQYGRGQSGRPGQGRPPASRSPSGPAPRSRPAAPPPTPARIKMSEIYGIGVVQSIDLQGGRVTIAYEPIEGVNWPAGTMPFSVAKTALLEGVTPGEKVRFRLESQQIAELKPFAPRQDQSAAPAEQPRPRDPTGPVGAGGEGPRR